MNSTENISRVEIVLSEIKLIRAKIRFVTGSGHGVLIGSVILPLSHFA